MAMKHKTPLILASGSRARNEMLQNVGLEFQKISADIDEQGIINSMNGNAESIALELGKQKALHISAQNPDAYVIGSDQILECDGQLFQKAASRDEARAKLKSLRGRTHHLISSVSIAKSNEIIWSHTDTASLTMHDFDDTFLEEYLISAKDDILSCVGAYAFEGYGAWLFKEINANYFTILGMPLLPLLAFLREESETVEQYD